MHRAKEAGLVTGAAVTPWLLYLFRAEVEALTGAFAFAFLSEMYYLPSNKISESKIKLNLISRYDTIFALFTGDGSVATEFLTDETQASASASNDARRHTALLEAIQAKQ
jgi:hypothetical protein